MGKPPMAMNRLHSLPQNPMVPFGERTDQTLESKGTIFQGRDEKQVIKEKKQSQAEALRQELEMQIQEKNRLKEIEQQKQKEREAKEDARIKKDLEELDLMDQEENDIPTKTIHKQFQQTHNIFGPPKEEKPVSPPSDPKIASFSQVSEEQPVVATVNPDEEEAITNLIQEPTVIKRNQEEPDEEKLMKATATFSQADVQQSPKLGKISAEETEKLKEMINQCDNKEVLQQMILERKKIKQDLESGKPADQVDDLSHMVQKLLSEQNALKSKLSERDRMIEDLQMKRTESVATPSGNQLKKRQKREHQTEPKERKRAENFKKSSSADYHNLHARKMRQKHQRDQQKVSQIEDKIEKARIRREEKLKQDKKKSRRVGVGNHSSVSRTDRPGSDVHPRAKRNQMNRDMEEVVSQMTEAASTVKPQRKKKKPSYASQNTSLAEEHPRPPRKSQISSRGEDDDITTRMAKFNHDYSPMQHKVSSKIATPMEDPGFMLSMPPEDDDYSAYSAPIKGGISNPTEHDIPQSTDADQLDLLMNQYQDPNMPPSLSDLTTSLGINPNQYMVAQQHPVAQQPAMYIGPEEVSGYAPPVYYHQFPPQDQELQMAQSQYINQSHIEYTRPLDQQTMSKNGQLIMGQRPYSHLPPGQQHHHN